MATSVVLEKVEKRYGSAAVIHGIDLRVDPGDFAVFVGPSGCGKSTLLRMIAGLEEISGGALKLDGQRMNEVPASKRGIAMVFQSYALYPHMSVWKNLAFGLETAGLPKAEIETRVARAAGILRIEPLLQRKPKALSGGQRQRVAIGRAIVREPKIFLFDEPLSNLDAELRVQMRVEISGAAPRPRQHDDLRHPRPGRGDDDGDQDRGAERRPDRAGRRRRSTSTTIRSTSSWRASSAARR